MITSDQEQQVKLQFLDEATDYLDVIESGLQGLGTGRVTGKQLDGLLRSAHSIKGGAGMMGYTTLAKLGHHLEDYFKIIQYGRSEPPDADVEQWMLGTIDRLRQIVDLNRQGLDADAAWLKAHVDPLFDRLRERLGEFNPEDEANMLASESGEDILTFLFESEVERSLTQLESSVNGDNSSSLYDELLISAEELGGLAEMLELPAMGHLCASVLAHLKSQPHQIRAIAALALAAWRRTQAMVLIGQTANLPGEIELPGSGIVPLSEAETIPEWNGTIDRDSMRPDRSFDIDLNNFEIADFGDAAAQTAESAAILGDLASANDFQTLTDPFGSLTVQPTFSTITDSDDLDAFATNEQNSDELTPPRPIFKAGATFSTITNSTDLLNEFITNDRSTIGAADDEEIVDAFEMLDLSGDLSLDTDAPELLASLSGFLVDMPADE
ncbi:Hpt domain-containing protein, partial [Chamaesiphon sp. VAR_69_metabat_338]|uniref:Hpt domain-containing protein n=1 Tax=Chamaesiphon sp. VAR_69_metabat_338 TaxID=2964704 RepID=UPI00286DCAA7